METNVSANYTVIVIPALKDNYSYYVHPSGNINEGFYVDVAASEDVEKFKKKFNV